MLSTRLARVQPGHYGHLQNNPPRDSAKNEVKTRECFREKWKREKVCQPRIAEPLNPMDEDTNS